METLSLAVSEVNLSEPQKSGFLSPETRNSIADWIAGLGGLAAAQRFRDCGEGGRGWVGVCPNGHNVYHAFGCMLRVCPRCASAASRKLAEKLTPAIQSLVLASPATLGVKHITLTTNVCLLDYVKVEGRVIGQSGLNELREIIKLLRGSAADMFRDQFASKEGVGWAIGVEFGGNLMLHFHVLALVPFWDQKDLSDAWRMYSLGRGYIVDIRAAGREVDEIEKAVGYVSKYVTKPLSKKKSNSLASSRVAAFVDLHGGAAVSAALWFVFKGVRRFQTYGVFYDLELPPEVPEICPDCGSSLHWVSEWEFLSSETWEFLNSLKTNKSVGEGGLAPPKVLQLGFVNWLHDVDFMS